MEGKQFAAVFFHDDENEHSRVALRHFTQDTSHQSVSRGIHPIVAPASISSNPNPRIELYKRGKKQQTLSKESVLRNVSMAQLWISRTHGRHLSKINEYHHDFVEYSSDVPSVILHPENQALLDSKIHVYLFLSPYSSLHNADVVEALHTSVHSFVDKNRNLKSFDPDIHLLKNFSFVYVPYAVSKHRRFLESFNMVHFGSMRCKETKHIFVVIKNEVIQLRKEITSIDQLKRSVQNAISFGIES
ncbi:MAG: hypothetical protein ACTSUE_00235 [Promethearchaeota archaeon]